MLNNRRTVSILALCAFCLFSFQTSAQASTWAKKKSYGAKTAGKLGFGLKHTLGSWLFWWTESREPQYQKEWQGFSVGIGKSVIYTASGVVQLVTFFIPVDFPDMGIGLHIPSKECPNRHDPNYVPPAPNPVKKLQQEGASKPTPMRLTETPEEAPAEEPVKAPETAEPAPAPAAPVIVEAKPAPQPVLHPGELNEEETLEAKKAEVGISHPVEKPPEEDEEDAIPEESELEAMDRELNAFLASGTASNSAAPQQQNNETDEEIFIPQSRS